MTVFRSFLARRRGRCWPHACAAPGEVYCGRHGRSAGWPCAAPVEASGPGPWRFEPVAGVRPVEVTQPVSSLRRSAEQLPWSNPSHDVLADLQDYRRRAVEEWRGAKPRADR